MHLTRQNRWNLMYYRGDYCTQKELQKLPQEVLLLTFSFKLQAHSLSCVSDTKDLLFASSNGFIVVYNISNSEYSESISPSHTISVTGFFSS